MKINKESNLYTLFFAFVLVLVVAVSLSFLSEFLKPEISTNKVIEKKQNILTTLGIKATAEDAIPLYKKHIIKELLINTKGEVVAEGKKAFDFELAKEMKKPRKDQLLPLFLAKNTKGEEQIIVPLRGFGLWGPIWGYMAIRNDMSVAGVVFDHASETPGLGAEITRDFFAGDFIGEKLVDNDKNFVGIDVNKTNGDPSNTDKEDNEVDAISGATITSVGVSKMIKERLELYLPYLKKHSNYVK